MADRHWQRIGAITNKTFDIESESFTLGMTSLLAISHRYQNWEKYISWVLFFFSVLCPCYNSLCWGGRSWGPTPELTGTLQYPAISLSHHHAVFCGLLYTLGHGCSLFCTRYFLHVFIGSIMEADLLKHKEDIEDICISALKEKDIEAKLKAIIQVKFMQILVGFA